MKRQYHRWFSHNLGRDMEILIFGHSGAKVLVFPAREGRFYDYENWGLVNVLAHTVNAGNITLFCVDGVDSESLYGRHVHPSARAGRHRQYERYIVEEVLPLMRSESGSNFFISHGCSIGAFHAVNIALRHPRLFSKIVALSGRYDLTRPIGHFQDLFDGHYDQDIYFLTPNHFLPNLNDPNFLDPIRHLDITLAIGDEDPFLESNFTLSQTFHQKQVPHRLILWPGEAHRPRFWREMVPNYL